MNSHFMLMKREYQLRVRWFKSWAKHLNYQWISKIWRAVQRARMNSWPLITDKLVASYHSHLMHEHPLREILTCCFIKTQMKAAITEAGLISAIPGKTDHFVILGSYPENLLQGGRTERRGGGGGGGDWGWEWVSLQRPCEQNNGVMSACNTL